MLPASIKEQVTGDDMFKKAVSIILTDKCNASCQICCFGCKPQNNQVIDESLMLDVIEQASRNKNIEYIGFSGGEPFLYYELLKKGVNYAKELGFKTSVATNGFWGEWSEDELHSKLSELQLDKMFISTDYYHSQYIPSDIFGQAIVAAKTLGIDTEVGIGETKSGQSSGEYFQGLGDYKYLMRLYTYPFVRAGRAEELPYEDFYRFTESKNLRCRSNGLISVRYDGEVFPCCEQMVFDTTLALGNIREKSLEDILSDQANSALLAVLMSEGFNQIVETAKETFKLAIPEFCASSCEICHTLFKDREFADKLKPYIDEEYGKLAVAKLLGR